MASERQSRMQRDNNGDLVVDITGLTAPEARLVLRWSAPPLRDLLDTLMWLATKRWKR